MVQRILVMLSLACLACSDAGPVAPVGSTLSIVASPVEIDPDGTAQITVVARRSTGFPVAPGTAVFLSTTLGIVSPTRGETDADGVVRASLFGNGEVGEATVVAASGGAEDVAIVVLVGELENL
jgi:hypothetical protein